MTRKSYLDASPEDTKYLNLVFGNQLRKGNQDTNLDRHLSVILHAVSANGQDRPIGSNATDRKTGFLSAVNSIQFKPNAMILEKVAVAAMNLMVSVAPQSRSR